MGTAVVEKKGSAVARRQSYAQALYGLNDGGGDFDGRALLRMKEGEWLFGENNEPLHNDDVLAVNPDSFRAGWICFNDSNEVAETEEGVKADFMWPVGQELDEDEIYDQHPLPEVKGKRAKQLDYQRQVGVDLVVIKGPNKGEEVTYKVTSVGGKRMLAKLAGEIARRIEDDDPDSVPVIALWADSYYNRNWKRDVWNPKADILDWVDADTREWDDEGEEADDGPTKHPKKGERTKRGDKVDNRRASRKAEAEGDDDKPARKSRRKKPEPEPEVDEAEEDLDEDEDEVEEEAPRSRSRRSSKRSADTDKPARARRGRAAADDEDEDEAEEPAPRGRKARAARDEDDEPRSARGDRSERGSRRRKQDDDDDDAEEDADEAPRGRRASRGARASTSRGRR